MEDGKLIHVPTTLIAIANSPEDSTKITSAEFQRGDHTVLYFPFPRDKNGLPLWDKYREILIEVRALHADNLVASSSVVESGGVAASVAKMCFGNKIGFQFEPDMLTFDHDIGGIILELNQKRESYDGTGKILGQTSQGDIIVNTSENGGNGGLHLSLEDAQEAWEKKLQNVYPQESAGGVVEEIKGHTKRGDTERTPILFDSHGRIISG